MMTAPWPLTRELVLVGGGHAHALVLRAWGMAPLAGARLTLIDPQPTAAYSGMLPGHVAGHYGRRDLDIDLVRLARFAGARLILGRAEAIDLARRRIAIAGRGEVAYDVASIDIGITSEMPALPGFADHGVPAKPLDAFARRWARFLDGAEAGAAVAVLGGGVAGCELAMAAAHALGARGLGAEVTVIDRARALSEVTPGAGRRLRAAMAALGVRLEEGVGVARVTAAAVELDDGRAVAADLTVGAVAARPHDWPAAGGLAHRDGFVAVDARLATSDAAVFAAGDCAHLTHAPRPKAGVFAVREAPVLARNLRAALSGRRPRRYRPQRDYLKLVSLGGRAALAQKAGLAIAGPWVWRWKDRIDRRFMARLTDLPAMPAPRLPRTAAAGLRAAVGDGKPMCGGCGAKVGAAGLARVLQALPPAGRADVESLPGDDAAVLCLGGTRQVLSIDHLRAFSDDPWTLARIAAVHALGDVWAMGAAPQAALASVVLPPMTPALQEQWLAEITAAASEVFAAEGAAVVGGHSARGAELMVGFGVTGLAARRPVTLAGARPGDRLILTKPLGTGTVLAGEMALRAEGAWVAAALASMARPQGGAARRLGAVHAMTDVTGFGLAGHLMAMLDASGVGAALDLAALPLLPGAEALAARGVRSTLFPDNLSVAARMQRPQSPRSDLLFDPQTAGGLLAAVAAGTAEAAVGALCDEGFEAAIIGEIREGPPFLCCR